jgi:hypothetical protein
MNHLFPIEIFLPVGLITYSAIMTFAIKRGLRK